MAFDTLFSPIRIGTMQLPNRVVMSPMTTDYGTFEQEPSERLMAYIEARAMGGVGLITLEVCSVAIDHRYLANSLSLAEDRFIPLHRKLVDMVHRHGNGITRGRQGCFIGPTDAWFLYRLCVQPHA